MKKSCCGVYGLLGRCTRSFAEASRRSEKASEATLSPSTSHTFSLSVNFPSTCKQKSAYHIECRALISTIMVSLKQRIKIKINGFLKISFKRSNPAEDYDVKKNSYSFDFVAHCAYFLCNLYSPILLIFQFAIFIKYVYYISKRK